MNPSARNCPAQNYNEIVSEHKYQFQVYHAFVRWSIEKFSSFPTEGGIYAISPEFILKETSWNLEIHPRLIINGQNGISLRVIRHKSDYGPTTVRSSYRLGMENAGNKIWFEAKEGTIFRKGDCYDFRTTILGHLEAFLSKGVQNRNDTLLVLCEIYIWYDKQVNIASTPIKLCVDSHLSSNFVRLLNSQQHADISIEVSNYLIKAHKSVLFARSRTLARILEEGKSCIKFSCSRSCLLCVLLYIYSGNIDILAESNTFSIGVFELACQLSLIGLRDILIPYKIEMKSKIDVERFTSTCTLHNFELRDLSNRSIESPVCVQRETGMSVKFCLQNVIIQSGGIDVHVEVSGFFGTLHSYLDVFLLNKSYDPPTSLPAKFSEDSELKFKDSVFYCTLSFPVSDILSCVSGGNLYLKFVCVRHSLKHKASTFTSFVANPELVFTDTNIWLKDLSSDLIKLAKTSDLSDVTIKSSKELFRLHRPILAARSGYFHRLFLNEKYKNGMIEISDVEPRILSLIIIYIYSGTFSDTLDVTKEDIVKLYKVAEKFAVQSLINKCAEYLTLKLDPFFVFDVKSLAEKYNNTQLKEACDHYINSLGTVAVDVSSKCMKEELHFQSI